MVTADKQRLMDHVQNIADRLAFPFIEWDAEEYGADDPEYGVTAVDYLEGVLDIVHYVSSDGTHLGAELLVAFGGPNIYVDTRHKTVEGFWWGDHHKVRLSSSADENVDDLNDSLEMLTY